MTGSYRMAQGHDGRLRARGTSDPVTGTAPDPTPTSPALAPGSVVAFRRKKASTGFGQVETVAANGMVTVRTWWPCPTRTVRLLPADVRYVADLEQLTAALLRCR
ncbi:MAG: hypothetical protein AB7H92_14075 [Microbacteriaceae bacterium]